MIANNIVRNMRYGFLLASGWISGAGPYLLTGTQWDNVTSMSSGAATSFIFFGEYLDETNVKVYDPDGHYNDSPGAAWLVGDIVDTGAACYRCTSAGDGSSATFTQLY